MNALLHLVRSVLAIGLGMLLLAILGAATGSAHATTVGVHALSAHWNVRSDTPQQFRPRSQTPGVYLRTDADHIFGLVRNSYGRTGAYAGHVWETQDKRFALTLGAISGYQKRRVVGQAACRSGAVSTADQPCWWDEGVSSAKLRLLVAPSLALPAVAGATPRLNLLGKGLNLSVEWVLP
jgi:hypothetical protein